MCSIRSISICSNLNEFKNAKQQILKNARWRLHFLLLSGLSLRVIAFSMEKEMLNIYNNKKKKNIKINFLSL